MILEACKVCLYGFLAVLAGPLQALAVAYASGEGGDEKSVSAFGFGSEYYFEALHLFQYSGIKRFVNIEGVDLVFYRPKITQ